MREGEYLKRNFFIFTFVFFIFYISFFILTASAEAALLPQPTGGCPKELKCIVGKCAPEGTSPESIDPNALPCNYTLSDILQSGVNFVNLILGIAGSIALLMFVYGGYQMLISMGNPETIKKGKDTLTNGFIGLIIVLGGLIFVQFAGALIGGVVKPTGEVEVGEAPCEIGKDGISVSQKCAGGSNLWACYKGACVPACDFKAATEEAFYGYSCQIALGKTEGVWECTKSGELKEMTSDIDWKKFLEGADYECKEFPAEKMICKKGLCPGGEDYQCCITAGRKKLIEEQKKTIMK